MQVELSMEQLEYLLEVLSERQRDLTLEISHTSKRDFREALRHQHFLIETIIDNLNAIKASALQECP